MSSVESEGRRRAVVDKVEPAVDRGRFPIKRTVGESIVILADVVSDGHDSIRCDALVRWVGDEAWHRVAMQPLGNDAWRAELHLDSVGRLEYSVETWVDHFGTWLRDLRKRIDAGQDVAVDLLIGSRWINEAVSRASQNDRVRLVAWQALLSQPQAAVAELRAGGFDELGALMDAYPDRRFASRYDAKLEAIVDRQRARFSSWYEFFPRSTSTQSGKHGTFADCTARLPYVAELGFDVLYLPPIHPIGRQFRKGKNNAASCVEGDHGSPWAIGGPEGGHKALHPDLGSLDDFRRLVQAAQGYGIDLALDIAFQCAPDHPYVKDHPDWFRQRPDGTIQYAENPPKKYQDIYPFDFETADWQNLWDELTSVVLYWAEQGVRVFRVDNPHTKPFPFWEYLIGQVKARFPETIFLSEAFTRPKVMYRLAKLGFTQSYTYFTWRNNKDEFVEYFTELTKTNVAEYFRPNLWPNTPDILPEHLQTGGRAAFEARLVLAATLGASYGIYGPAYELLEHTPRDHGGEEYVDSEKYEIRQWNLDREDSLRPFIAKVNRIRHANPALHSNTSLRFHETDDPFLLCYSKQDPTTGNRIIVVVNLDFANTQGGHMILPLAELGVDEHQPFAAIDLLTGERFEWGGPKVYVRLDPTKQTSHIFRIE